jgi:aryl-alcohol dehydrogenase-like predicted oxidoreductase
MRYQRLGDHGPTVPVLILGCGNFGGVGSAPELFGRGDTEDVARALLDRALEFGITMIDTANSYGGGRSEEWIGRWLVSRGVRDRMILTTKVFNRVGPHPRDAGLSRRHIHEQIDASLRRLRTDRVDLYLAHAADPATPVEETVAAFDELIRAGKIRHYGLSNFTAPDVDRVVTAADRLGAARPVNVQDGHNLLGRAVADLFDGCARHGIGFTAFSPLAGGLLSGRYRAGRPFPDGSRMALRPEGYGQVASDAVFGRLETLRAVAAARGLTLATLALAWALTDPAVTAVLLGARSPQQLVELSACLDAPLTASERDELARIVEGRD